MLLLSQPTQLHTNKLNKRDHMHPYHGARGPTTILAPTTALCQAATSTLQPLQPLQPFHLPARPFLCAFPLPPPHRRVLGANISICELNWSVCQVSVSLSVLSVCQVSVCQYKQLLHSFRYVVRTVRHVEI